MGPIIYITAL